MRSAETRRDCPRCGAECVEGALAGNCPHCLMRQLVGALEEPEVEDEFGESTLGKLGDFELLGELGRGGMGVVYRARHLDLGRMVALKVLGQGLPLGDGARARFTTEMAASARLSHPNVVTLYESGEDGHRLYFAMELVEGQDLGKWVQSSGPMPSRRAAEVVAHVADALQHAHQRGVIHRDLKPTNILLDTAGKVRVVDFGLARILEGTAAVPLTMDGQILGTPAYMAPEMAMGHGKNAGALADVYAVGAVLFYLLTGRAPFVGETIGEILGQVTEHEPPSPKWLSPGVPAPLATICLKCLAKEPGRRYASARELAEDLRRFHRGEAIQAKPAGPWLVGWLWVRRHPAWATVLVLMVLAMASMLWAGVTARTSRLLDEQRRLADYVADINLARQALAQGNLVRAHYRLDLQDKETNGKDPRGFEWWWLKELGRGQESRVLFQSSNAVTALALATTAPVFVAAGEGWVGLWNVEGELEQSWETRRDGEPLALALTRDGGQVAVAWTNRVELYARSGERIREWTGVGGNTLAFSPSGKRLAVNYCPGSASDDPKDVVVMDLESGKEWRLAGRGGSTLRWETGEASLQLVRFYGSVDRWRLGDTNLVRLLESGRACYSAGYSESGRWLARGIFDGTVSVDPMGGHDAGKSFVGQAPRGVRIAFSEGDQRLVLAGGAEARLTVWDTVGWVKVDELLGHVGEITGVRCLGTNRVVSASRDGTVRLWEVGRPQRVAHQSIPHQLESFNTRAPVFSPDGRWLAASRFWGEAPEPMELRDSSLLWDFEVGTLRTNLPGRPVAFSPDSRVVLTWRQDGELRAFEMATGRGGAGFRVANAAPHWHEELLSADGTRFVGHDAKRRLHLYDAFTGARLATASRECWVWTVSPRGLLAAYATPSPGNDIVIWDLETCRERVVLHLSREAPELQFSPDLRWLAVGSLDQRIHLIELATGTTKEMVGHQAGIMALDFSPDSRTLASGGDDLDLILWNVESRRELFSKSQPGPIYWVRFAPDGQALLSGHVGTSDGRVPSEYRIWPAPRGLRNAKGVAGPSGRPGRRTVWERVEIP